MSLNSNCQNLIILYLIPLPELPFLGELKQKTDEIYIDLSVCSYSSSSFMIRSRTYCYGKFRVYYHNTSKFWYIDENIAVGN